MAVFVIIPTSTKAEALESAITSKFGARAYKLPRGEWLVPYHGTSRMLSDELRITGEEQSGSTAIVASISGYYGLASTDVWEWIKQNWEA